ncbi:ROK family transcriptional regulator [Phytomonospora endophytica]|uniref:Putative NBD/HSP70 family sugar kinase n=1 Tax=Phytomonospora endophytica TaxID=714109 RepID=A0A841FK21_9ACTN|nr:ROK family transcriptional regulator [Phytomonospora endophytica]MBB6034178.1 putative NBD/HSP70 family sugar kinase [Phytomonospora endophytica]GIG66570.1 transcriptional regulator [Phytomonospora endophytica]
MSGFAATGPHVLRRMNATAVLGALRASAGGTARVADLMGATGLSRPAVTRALGLLADAGIVEFFEGNDSRVGRPAVRARFRAELGHVAGIDVGPHKVLVMITDLAGNVRAQHRVVGPPAQTGPELAGLLRTTLVEAADEAGVAPGDLWAVGVGTPGVVDHERGEVVLAPSIPGWAGVSLLAELREWLGCPVHIDNDVNLAVVAERWRGETSDNLLFVQWGERIGSGIVIGGKPYRGANSASGELGFLDLVTPIDAEPPQASDGLGSFERLVGARAILGLAVERCAGLRAALEHGDIAPLFTAAEGGDADAVATVDVVAARFARGLAAQLLILDPGLVVVGGGVSRAGTVLFDAVRRHLRRLLLVPVELRVSALREQGVALGAVRMALDSAERRLAKDTAA